MERERLKKRKPNRDSPVNLNLDSLARQALNHWRKHRPKLYKELKKQGRLEEAARRASQLTWEELGQLIEKGLSYDQAWELVRENYVFLPSQEDVPILGENPDRFIDPVILLDAKAEIERLTESGMSQKEAVKLVRKKYSLPSK